MKKILLLALALIMALGCMTACIKDGGQEAGEKTVVAIVVAGQFGDRSFYDSSKAGGDRLAKDFSNVEVKYIECNNDNHAVQMRNAADIANIVVRYLGLSAELVKVYPALVAREKNARIAHSNKIRLVSSVVPELTIAQRPRNRTSRSTGSSSDLRQLLLHFFICCCS